MIKFTRKDDAEIMIASIDNINLDENYDEILNFISEGAKAETFAAGLVFEELFVNVYNYAYEEMKDVADATKNGPIAIKVEHTDSHTKITMADYGIPFNPIKRGEWMANSNQIGGRGIDLVKAYSSSFKYKRVFDMNVVEVIILLHPE